MKCNLCPRQCNVNRDNNEVGFCGVTNQLILSRAALHYWEEPCISGKNGSGAVFFSGCNLKCIYCQNRKIALGNVGREISLERLSEIFLELQEKNANNINLVTGSHYIPQIVKAVEMARNNGLIIPIVYNTSSYENPDSIKRLEGIVDIYLPDFKYADSALAAALSNAGDYPMIALKAIEEMIYQKKDVIFNGDMLKSGVIIRHLILPGHTKNSMSAIDNLMDKFGKNIYLSIMNQYTPPTEKLRFSELNRKVTKREYNKVIDYALDKGLVNGFFQEDKTADESFIPDFNYEGL